MFRIVGAVLCLVGLTVGSAPLRADDGDDRQWRPEQLFFATPPYPPEQGEVELTLGASLLDWRDRQEIEVMLEAEYGITDAFQIGIAVPYRFLRLDGEEDEDGIGDIELEALYNFAGTDSPLIASASLGISLPTGSEKRDLGEGKVEVEPALLLGAHFGPAALYGNVGASFGGETAFNYAVAGAYAMGAFTGIVELAGSHSSEEDLLYLTPGLAWLPWDNAQVLFGVPIGLTGDAADWGAIVLLTVEFE